MNKSIMKDKIGANLIKLSVSTRNANVKMEVEVKHGNKNSIKSEESYHPHDICQNSEYETVKLKVNCKIEVKEEPILVQAIGKQLKKETEIHEEPSAFTVENYLVKHDLIHTDEKSYQCSFCQKSFSHTNKLYIHMSTHRSVAIQKLDSQPLPVHTGNGVYIGSQCDKNFSQKRYLKNHPTSHIGENPYQCSQCDKAFSHKNNLIKHQRTHTGEKPC
ncbi:unnamed protein product [Meganyctiphanes norvegica]|uniref:C2H2-type domain-containing protein n=1 Tax=Meganyctiphanes norvegica TaxID=48144 RepID=A0AAV2SDJ7_MEGNR